MVYTKKFLESAAAKQLPDWIRTHRVFKTNKRIKKVFPAFGLQNCIEKAPPHPAVEKGAIVFSSVGTAGLWDIATMSMRGALSCMHWHNPHCSHLIGSMVDPACGIIYLTDGEQTRYGLSMIKRAVVRVAFNEDKPFMFIDRIYSRTKNKNPLVYSNHDKNAGTTSAMFVEFLKSKVKIPVFSVGRTMPGFYLYNAFIHRARILRDLTYVEQSIIDCGIRYGVSMTAGRDLLRLFE